MSAEREISRLTQEAKKLFTEGRFAEAKLYLEEVTTRHKSAAPQ